MSENNPGDSSRDRSIPLVGGHQQPLISGHVFTHHPHKGHDCRIASTVDFHFPSFSGVFFGCKAKKLNASGPRFGRVEPWFSDVFWCLSPHQKKSEKIEKISLGNIWAVKKNPEKNIPWNPDWFKGILKIDQNGVIPT